MIEYIEKLRSERAIGKELPFAIYDIRTSRLVGVTRYINVEWGPARGEADRRSSPIFLEIGRTWLAASAQGTQVNTESKLLLLTYAFEVLDVGRVSFRTDEADERAAAAVLRLGAWFEGVRRGQEIGPDGTMRNSACFSITAIEWPAVKPVLLQRLAAR